jgi:hypothetical protein
MKSKKRLSSWLISRLGRVKPGCQFNDSSMTTHSRAGRLSHVLLGNWFARLSAHVVERGTQSFVIEREGSGR